jgi:protein translocase SecG subunit
MTLLIGFLTFILVVNCLFLILLVLVQLPKKEAGAGIAFGGAATDALFGAGSGNALTKMTKYAAGCFLAMALVLAMLNAHTHQSSIKNLQQQLSKKSSAAPLAIPPLAPPVTSTNSNQGTLITSTNSSVAPNAGTLSSTGAIQSLNIPATSTNSAPAAAPATNPGK